MRQLIHDLAKQARKDPEDANRILDMLDEQWVSSLFDWGLLSDEQKRQVKLPVWISSKLDLLASARGESSTLLPLVSPGSSSLSLGVHLSSSFSSSSSSSSSPPPPLPACASSNSHVAHSPTGNCHARHSLPSEPNAFLLRWKNHGVSLTLGDRMFEMSGLDPVGTLLNRIAGRHPGYDFALLDGTTGAEAPPGQPICEVLLPGALLRARPAVSPDVDGGGVADSERRYRVARVQQLSTIEAWLESIGMGRHFTKFLEDSFLDFWALVFLERAGLEYLGITSAADQDVILASLHSMVHSSQAELNAMWLRLLNCEDLIPRLSSKNRSMMELGSMDEFENSAKPAHRRLIREMSGLRTSEAIAQSFSWMRERGFDESAFVSVRSNLPFYMIPSMTTSVQSLDLILPEDRPVYDALHKLKDSPTFQSRALWLWLRDLGLEHHGLLLAKLRYNTIERLGKLSPKDYRFFLDWEVEQMRTGLGTIASEQDAAIEQMLSSTVYGEVCKRHLISIEMLPKLTAVKLQKMGVDSPADRALLLELCANYRAEMPQSRGGSSNGGGGGGSNDGGSKDASRSFLANRAAYLRSCAAMKLLAYQSDLGLESCEDQRKSPRRGRSQSLQQSLLAGKCISPPKGHRTQEQVQQSKKQQQQSIEEILSFINSENGGSSKSSKTKTKAQKSRAAQRQNGRVNSPKPKDSPAPSSSSSSSPTASDSPSKSPRKPSAKAAPTSASSPSSSGASGSPSPPSTNTGTSSTSPLSAPLSPSFSPTHLKLSSSLETRLDEFWGSASSRFDLNRSFAVETLLALDKVFAPTEFNYLIAESPDSPVQREDTAMFWMD